MRDDLNGATAFYIRPPDFAEGYWPTACDTLAEVVECFKEWATRCGVYGRYKGTTAEAGLYLKASQIGCMHIRRLPEVTL